MEHADAIIIGAGVAGLAAAQRLCAAGLHVLILEARARIGGRILTAPTRCGSPAELGAEFIHGKPPELLNLARKAHLKAHEITGTMWRVAQGEWQHGGKMFSREEEVLSQLHRARRDQSFTEFLRTHKKKVSEDLRPWLLGYVEGFNAADPAKISVRSLAQSARAADAIEGDRQLRLVHGYSQLLESMAQNFPSDRAAIKLNSKVTAVEWKRNHVSVRCNKKTYSARCVLITLPLPLLQNPSEVRFSPAINKHNALRHLLMGPVTRITLEFAQPFWHEFLPRGRERLHNLSFLFTQDRNFPTWWTRYPDPAPLLTGWAAGHCAQRLTGRSADEICDRTLHSLTQIFKTKTSRHSHHEFECNLRGFHTHDWQSDPFSRGAYSYAAVGGANAPSELAQPIANTLFFAGEATNAEGHSGTVHGAIATGYRAAQQMLPIFEEKVMASKKISAARKNIRKAAAAAKRKRTIAHLPKSVRTALGKEGAKAAARKRSSRAA